MTSDLQNRVINRLAQTGADDKPLALIVLAALEGEAALTAYLNGEQPAGLKPGATPANATTAGLKSGATPATAEPPGIYVSSITVEGLRGVGPSATLPLEPGPGLTLVVGRNGSGKSSFAEGLELLLTGRNARWEERAKAWRDGWRNLHAHGNASVSAGLIVEGKGPLTATRTWSGDDPGISTATVKPASGPASAFDSLGWDAALATFRPFLSYNELGSLLEDGPSKLYDALSSVLGLDELTGVQNAIANARKSRSKLMDEAKAAAAAIRERVQAALAQSEDDRLLRVVTALAAKTPDLAALDALVRDSGDSTTGQTELLRQVVAIQPPDLSLVQAAATKLRDAERALAAMAGTDAERSNKRGRLLQEALAFVDKHPTEDCPVCGSTGLLSAEWRESARTEAARLLREAGDYRIAQSVCEKAVSDAQRLMSPAPSCLADPRGDALGLATLGAVRVQWDAWAEGRTLTSPLALADHLESRVLELSDAVTTLVAEARELARQREDAWRPVADLIIAWLPTARRAASAAEQLPALKAAEAWWKDAFDEIREERFAPIRTRALAVWETLRLQSNVNLDDVALGGTAARRRVDLQVSVDGTEAGALGVMSQGELHSLALSLFLPRVTLGDSPFRFISIDDPVQSMDPARVEGLARVLADVARTRQVIVFTHDDRLPESVRRLGIPARVLAVTRRAQSVVEVRATRDPVSSYLDDARAVVKTEGLPKVVGPRVVPGFCRAAIEAACMDVVRRRRLAAGEAHDAVETLLKEHGKTHPLMALALFDDAARTNDVLARLNRFGRWAGDAFNACKLGAHEAYEGDLEDLVRSTERLAGELARVTV